MAEYAVQEWTNDDPATPITGDRLDAIEAGILAAGRIVDNPQTGTSYTLVQSDARQQVSMNNASANTVTVPPNSTTAFAIGTVIQVLQYGAGQTTIVAGAGVTIRAFGASLALAGQYAVVGLRKRATNEWELSGMTA